MNVDVKGLSVLYADCKRSLSHWLCFGPSGCGTFPWLLRLSEMLTLKSTFREGRCCPVQKRASLWAEEGMSFSEHTGASAQNPVKSQQVRWYQERNKCPGTWPIVQHTGGLTSSPRRFPLHVSAPVPTTLLHWMGKLEKIKNSNQKLTLNVCCRDAVCSNSRLHTWYWNTHWHKHTLTDTNI